MLLSTITYQFCLVNVKEHSRVGRALIQTRDRQLPFGRKIKMRIVHTKVKERAKIANASFQALFFLF